MEFVVGEEGHVGADLALKFSGRNSDAVCAAVESNDWILLTIRRAGPERSRQKSAAIAERCTRVDEGMAQIIEERAGFILRSTQLLRR